MARAKKTAPAPDHDAFVRREPIADYGAKFKFSVHCTHKHYKNKAGRNGKFVFHTNDLTGWRARCQTTGVRIDRVFENHA